MSGPPTPLWTSSEPSGARRRRRLRNALIALVALGLATGALVAAVVLLAGGDDGSGGSVAERPAGDERPSGSSGGVEQPSRGARGLGASPLTPAGMRSALAVSRRRLGERPVQLLRVDASAVQVIAKGRLLVLRRDQVLDLPGPSVVPSTFTLGRVDPRAPGRLDRALGGRMDYAVLEARPVGRGVQWIAFRRGGKGYTADAAGRGLCPLGRLC
jgi:hypothetical protein